MLNNKPRVKWCDLSCLTDFGNICGCNGFDDSMITWFCDAVICESVVLSFYGSMILCTWVSSGWCSSVLEEEQPLCLYSVNIMKCRILESENHKFVELQNQMISEWRINEFTKSLNQATITISEISIVFIECGVNYLCVLFCLVCWRQDQTFVWIKFEFRYYLLFISNEIYSRREEIWVYALPFSTLISHKIEKWH